MGWADVATQKLPRSALSVALEGSPRQLVPVGASVGASAVDSVTGVEEDSVVAEEEEASAVVIEVDSVGGVEVLGTKVEEALVAAVVVEAEVGMGVDLTAMVLPQMHLLDLAAVEASAVGLVVVRTVG